ncbi:hypothetical protein AAHE18_09G085300 [Arachis hypogaea]
MADVCCWLLCSQFMKISVLKLITSFICFVPLSKQGRCNEQRANRVKMKRTYCCFRINEFHICMNFFSALVTLSKLPSLCKVSKCFNESSKRIV